MPSRNSNYSMWRSVNRLKGTGWKSIEFVWNAFRNSRNVRAYVIMLVIPRRIPDEMCDRKLTFTIAINEKKLSVLYTHITIYFKNKLYTVPCTSAQWCLRIKCFEADHTHSFGTGSAVWNFGWWFDHKDRRKKVMCSWELGGITPVMRLEFTGAIWTRTNPS
jgi:hypothetical protein